MKMKVIQPDGTEKIVEDLSWQCVSNSKLPGKNRSKKSKIPDAIQRQQQSRAYKLKTILNVLDREGHKTLVELCLITGVSKQDMQAYLRDLEINKQVRSEGKRYFLISEVE